MPPAQRRQAYRHDAGRWGLRYYDRDGRRRRVSRFPSKSAALARYRDVVEPALRGEAPELTLSAFVELYLERHAVGARTRTIGSLRQRLRYATRAYGGVPLRELERMVDELAGWHTRLPARSRYGILGALRQTLGAAVRWDYMSSNPAKALGPNRQAPPRTVRVYTYAELEAIAAELSKVYRPLPTFVAATGLRPEEWAPLERRDVDRRAGVVNIRRTVSDGEVVELGKTSRSRRRVPLTRRSFAALEALPAQLRTPLLFPAPEGGLLRLDNFRRREWTPAVEAAAIAKPARIYDLRSTFASNSLAAGATVFELARVMDTSVAMIERHYGTLLEGAQAGLASRLDAFEAELGPSRQAAAEQAP